jgi:hypothetical protein
VTVDRRLTSQSHCHTIASLALAICVASRMSVSHEVYSDGRAYINHTVSLPLAVAAVVSEAAVSVDSGTAGVSVPKVGGYCGCLAACHPCSTLQQCPSQCCNCLPAAPQLLNFTSYCTPHTVCSCVSCSCTIGLHLILLPRAAHQHQQHQQS